MNARVAAAMKAFAVPIRQTLAVATQQACIAWTIQTNRNLPVPMGSAVSVTSAEIAF